MFRVYNIDLVLSSGEVITNFLQQHASCRDDVIDYLTSLKTRDKIVGSISTYDIQSFEINHAEHNSYLPENQAEQDAIESCDCPQCKGKDINSTTLKPDGSEVTLMDYINDLEITIQTQVAIIDHLESDLKEVSRGKAKNSSSKKAKKSKSKATKG